MAVGEHSLYTIVGGFSQMYSRETHITLYHWYVHIKSMMINPIAENACELKMRNSLSSQYFESIVKCLF